MSLPLDCMFPNPQEIETTDIHEFLHNKQETFQRVFELVRRNLKENQKCRNAIYSKKVQGPTYIKGQKILLYQPANAVGKTSKFTSR